MKLSMSPSTIVRFINPWKARREQEEQRLHALRRRDGNECRRCRRSMRFDLPHGHDLRAVVVPIVPTSAGGTEELDNLCLTHVRCNAKDGHDTAVVKERVRLKSEAALFEDSRKRRRA
jgi:hypothetical protein